MKKSRYCQWEAREENSYFPCFETTKRLPAGVYEIRFSRETGYHLVQQNIQTEDIVEIPVPEVQSILLDIQTFWEKRELYKQNNIVYKRGILLFGKAGTGKSYIIQQLIRNIIKEKDGIAIVLGTPQCVENYVEFAPCVLRAIEADRPVIVVMEEIDELIGRGYIDTPVKLLNILDGLRQVNGGTVYIATTNHIERLQDHFKNRPGRFDLKRKIALPTDDARLYFFKNKLSEEKQSKYDLQKWVDDTKGFSLAHLKELIIAVVIMNQDYEKTVFNLKSMADKVSSKDDDELINKIGF